MTANKTLHRLACLAVSCTLLLALSTPLRADLLGLYTFEGGIGDSSGNVADPVAFNNLNLVAGIDGTAAEFNGTDSYIDVPIDINPGPAPQLTMGAWVKSNVDTGTHSILSHDNGGWDRSIGVNNGPHVAFNGVNAPANHVNLTTDVQFVAVVYDGSLIRHYVDGDRLIVGDGTGDADLGTSNLRIGGLPGNASWNWDGLIDNVFVFDQALSEGEIAHVRANSVSGILNLPSIPDPPRTTLGVWDFETDDLSQWNIVNTTHGNNAVFTTPGNMPTTLPATGFDDSTVQGNHFIRTWDGDVLGNSDAPTGIIESEEFVLAADAQFNLLVGGGAHAFTGDPDSPNANMTAVTLERRVADGDWEMIATSSGPNGNFLSGRFWDASAFEGETVRLRIYDTHSGGWGHIDVDNIVYSSSIPEPSTLTLLAVAMIGLAGFGRRRSAGR